MALSYDHGEPASNGYFDEPPYVPTQRDYDELAADAEAESETSLLMAIASASKETKIKAWEELSLYVESLQQGAYR